jgi:cell wall-associated NlpC family hydrolase
MVLYENLFDIHLPRTTEGQVHAGVGLDKQDLQPGDLVFFRPSKTRHVGIYLSGGEFAHASSSEGVMVSRLDESYWQETYWTARRVLRPKTTAPLAADEQDRVSPPSAPSPVRSSTGW